MNQSPKGSIADLVPVAMNNRSVAYSYDSTLLGFVPPMAASGTQGTNVHGLLAIVFGKIEDALSVRSTKCKLLIQERRAATAASHTLTTASTIGE